MNKMLIANRLQMHCRLVRTRTSRCNSCNSFNLRSTSNRL